ncbi:MAG: biotin-dependent carboxyltransferase family protein [Burkholderiaceae bacterium]|nr:biotin-dependent carboxyltransferase family protein [Burkholderiaceae bacterium]
MTIDVRKPGLATSVQDTGRTGYYHLGIPPSGAMDRYSLRCANLLVGNAEDAAGLEITFLGPELAFQAATVVAVTGARLTPRVNGQEMPLDESFTVPAGGVLSFDYLKTGARAYLAVAGGIDVPIVLGSRSTYGLGALGGYEGRKLAAGDRLPVGAAGAAISGRKLPPEFVTETPREVELRVVVGLYDHWLTPESLAAFFDDEWTIASEADRIGYRFKGGRPMRFRPRERPFGAGSDPSNIVDACYPIGSIQIPGGLEPIVLHCDAVSGGGYAMLGTVINADLDRIAQLQPNYKARFVRVDVDQALAARREYGNRLARLRKAL